MIKTDLRIAALVAAIIFPLYRMPSHTATGTQSRDRSGTFAPAAERETKFRVAEILKRLPRSFEENQGQLASPVRFSSRGFGFNLFLTPGAVVFSPRASSAGSFQNAAEDNGAAERLLNRLRPEFAQAHRDAGPPAIEMRLIGGSAIPVMQGTEPAQARSNYLVGDNPRCWQTDVPHFARVRYQRVYPGIDMVFYGRGSELEFDLEAAPGADPNIVRFEFTGIETLKLDDLGDLVMMSAGGEVRLRKPLVYLRKNDRRIPIPAAYRIDGMSRVGFSVGDYDRSLPLIIDPILTYSTYLGGNGGDFGNGIAVDAAGGIYVVGETLSTDFPLKNPIRGNARGGFDVFVTKLNPADSTIVYSTYLGGSANDYGSSIAVDAEGAAYITGWTTSSDFPITATTPQFKYHGGVDSFVAKLSAAGSPLAYSFYLGGRGDDYGEGIAVSSGGVTCVTGGTSSADFPVADAIQEALKGGAGDVDAFATKVNAAGSAFTFSTYLGGTNADRGQGVAMDAAGNVYVVGTTESPDFPTSRPYQPVYGGFSGSTYLRGDVFVTKLISSGTAFHYSTFLGGRGGDEAAGVALDSSGAVYVAGCTDSPDFPVVHAFQQSIRGSIDGFVAKLAPAGTALAYSTFLGGSDNDFPRAIAVDASQSVYVTGFTRSINFPATNEFQAQHAKGLDDTFVTKLEPGGSALAYSGYLGGSSGDYGYGIFVDAHSSAFVVGHTYSTDFPTIHAYQRSLAGGSAGSITDIFIARIDSLLPAPSAAKPVSPSGNVATAKPAYVWNAVPEASWYQLWVNDSINGNGKIKIWVTAAQAGCAGFTATCSVTPSVALSSGPAQWWVQTYNETGYGPWSEGMSFYVAVGGPAKPRQISPFGEIATASPTYIWNAVPGATWYQLWVSDSSTTSGKVKAWYTAEQAGCAGGPSSCSITPAASLAPGAARWWIQAYGASGYGQWSDGMAFNVVSTGAAAKLPGTPDSASR